MVARAAASLVGVVAASCARRCLRLGLLWLLPVVAAAQSTPAPKPAPLYIVYDSSNSMWAPLADGQRKYLAAREAVKSLLPTLEPAQPVALRVYGSRSRESCQDSYLAVPAAPRDPSDASIGQEQRIMALIKRIRPTGQTPIAYSLAQAATDLGDGPGRILLITDGIESCDADPCALVSQWRAEARPVDVIVVGVGLSAAQARALSCMTAQANPDDVTNAQSGTALVEAVAKAAQTPGADSLVFVAPDVVGKLGRVQVPLTGVLRIAGEAPLEVRSHQRYVVPEGRHSLIYGVRTKSGERFGDQEAAVDRAEGSYVELAPPLPGLLQARAFDGDLDVTGTGKITARRGDRVVSLPRGEPAWLIPGRYEVSFESPRYDPLTRSVDLAAGEELELRMATEKVVHVLIRMVSTDRGLHLRHNLELERDGEIVGFSHVHNGAHVAPGEYVVHLDDRLGTYQVPIRVTEARSQQVTLEVPMAHLTVRYVDARGAPASKSRRVFVEQGPRGRTHYSGEPVPLLPGRYLIRGWPRGTQAKEIEVTAGQDVTVELGPERGGATP